MRAIKLRAAVDERAVLSFTLPSDVPSGTVEVIVLVDQGEMFSAAASGSGDRDSLDELLAFHRDHRLDGITLQEMMAEGRR